MASKTNLEVVTEEVREPRYATEVKKYKRTNAYAKVKQGRISLLTGVDKVEGELLQDKISRVTRSGEPIKDGAPEIFTEKKDGVIPGYNIRTDRWEIAAEAMDSVTGSLLAQSENVGTPPVSTTEEGSPDTGTGGESVA